MPQRLTKKLDLRTVSPTIRRTENMRLIPPRNIVQQPGIFVDSYTEDLGPVTRNSIMQDGSLQVWPPLGIARGRQEEERNMAPMPTDHNVLSHARNAAPMQTELGREEAAAAQRLLNRTTSDAS